MGNKPKENKGIDSMEDAFLKMVGGEAGFGDPFADEEEVDHAADLSDDSSDAVKKQSGPAAALSSATTPPTDAVTSVDFPKDLELAVSKDGMQAVLIGRNARSFEAKIIIQELKKRRIVQGLDLDIIYRTVSLFKESAIWNGKIVIARGEPAKARETVGFPFIEKKDLPGGEVEWLVEGKKLSFDMLKDIYDEEYMPDANEVGAIEVKVLDQGEVIATVRQTDMAAPGFNVYGDVITMADPILVPGKYVKKNEQSGNYEAMIFGFLYIHGNTVSLLPPLKIEPNHMEAYYLNPPQIGQPKGPKFNDLKFGLILKGIKEPCIRQKSIKALCDALAQNKKVPPLLKIASGVSPVNGVDAHFAHTLDLEKKAGEIREDESIDLKERNIVQSVQKGALIGEKMLLMKGSPGVTIFGKRIKYVQGEDIQIIVKGPIKRIRKNDRHLYYAKQNGNVSFHNNTLTLTDILKVDGNVDYASGNINVTTGLMVTESVLSGFKVKAGGNTLIGGTLENGCSIYVDGDLEVGKGIIGEKTKVFVMGSLQAEFIQDAEVMVKGDLTVNSYIFNGKVRAGGEIIVNKSASRRGGMVVGGVVCATTGIELSTIGSPANIATTVALQRDFELVGKLNTILSEIQTCTGTIAKMMRTVQIDDLQGETIKKLLASVPASKQELVLNLLDHLNKFIKHRKDLYVTEEGIRKRIDIRLKKAKIRVKDGVLAGNQVQIGDRKLEINDDLGRVNFQLQDGEISY